MSTNSENFNFVVNSTNQTQLTHPDNTTNTTRTSDKLKGDGYYGRADGLHSVQYVVTGFVGKIVTQATLATTPATTDWFDITSTVHDNSSGTSSNALATGSFIHNFTGNYVWIKIVVSDWTTGTVNSILLNH
jgi:hypothetical protein|tara:strand:- start:2734 stop:3129 length:396 start_codon:yes stop_codon:yes gene_type:complete